MKSDVGGDGSEDGKGQDGRGLIRPSNVALGGTLRGCLQGSSCPSTFLAAREEMGQCVCLTPDGLAVGPPGRTNVTDDAR